MVAMIGQAFLETTMYTHPTQPHYTPSSVGALMDPGFLRSAVIDANGERRTASGASTLRMRIQVAMHAVAVALRRH
jgi:hypothetical protein